MSIYRNKSQILSVLIYLSFCTSILSQELIKITKLPSIVNETSGIEGIGVDAIWTLNDSGGEAELYLCDTLGNLNRTLKITNAHNKDWEDIARDDKGNLYIGDIGNNQNKRKHLTIYKIANPDENNEKNTMAKIITFSFEDQKKFPPSKKNLNFDCEAMFWKNGYIYLFSKHRTYPSATNLYRIPAKEGNYSAKKLGTFYTGKKSGKMENIHKHWIAASDISPDGQRVCLINGKTLWVFYDFKDDDYFNGQCLEIDLGENTQKEAVCFITNDLLYITDEHWAKNDIGRNLYKLNLSTIFDE